MSTRKAESETVFKKAKRIVLTDASGQKRSLLPVRQFIDLLNKTQSFYPNRAVEFKIGNSQSIVGSQEELEFAYLDLSEDGFLELTVQVTAFNYSVYYNYSKSNAN